jgi:hypothetical protein
MLSDVPCYAVCRVSVQITQVYVGTGNECHKPSNTRSRRIFEWPCDR